MECPTCGGSFCDKYSLKKHWSRFPDCKRDDTAIEVSYTCDRCNKKFKSEFGYTNHINNTCRSIEPMVLQKKIEEQESTIKALQDEVSSMKEKVAVMKKRLKGRDSKRFSYSMLTSLRDIKELNDPEYIRSKIEEAVPEGETPLIDFNTFVMKVIVPIMSPYIISTSGARNTFIYRDDDVVIRKCGFENNIVECIADIVYNRLNFLSKMFNDSTGIPANIIALSWNIKAEREKVFRTALRYLYKRTKNIAYKDHEI